MPASNLQAILERERGVQKTAGWLIYLAIVAHNCRNLTGEIMRRILKEEATIRVNDGPLSCMDLLSRTLSRPSNWCFPIIPALRGEWMMERDKPCGMMMHEANPLHHYMRWVGGRWERTFFFLAVAWIQVHDDRWKYACKLTDGPINWIMAGYDFII